MTKLTAEEKTQALETFKSYDTNGNGTVTVKEYKEVLSKYMDDKQIERTLKEVNPDGNKVISLAEFEKALKN